MRKIKEKKERSLGTKLFIKAERCNSPKCVMVRRSTRPGQHGAARKTVTEYGRQLQEKQKIQIYYGLSNKQMTNLFKGNKVENAIRKLEHRLDQVVFKLGFARSPRIGRQLINHGHILVNGRKVTIPSYYVRVHDIISIRPESRSAKIFEDIQMRLKQYEAPQWLKLNKEELKGECVGEAVFDGNNYPFDANLVAQLYSR